MMAEDDSSRLSITDIPPEILERIFQFISSDVGVLRTVSQVCPLFYRVVLKVPVSVQIPLSEAQLRWLADPGRCIPVRSLANREIAAYVSDQVA